MRKAPGDLLRFMDQWRGQTVVCAASGPSITAEQLDFVKGKAKVICINDTYRLAPWCDVVYASDARWWDHHIKNVREKATGQLWTMQEKAAAEHFELFHAAAMRERDLNTEPGWINHGTHGGFQAINLAYQFGASKIILLGYDCKYVHHADCRPDQDGKCRPHDICLRHWFGSHPQGWGDANHITRWLESYRTIHCDRPIINCSPDSAVDAFPKMSLAEAFS